MLRLCRFVSRVGFGYIGVILGLYWGYIRDIFAL